MKTTPPYMGAYMQLCPNIDGAKRIGSAEESIQELSTGVQSHSYIEKPKMQILKNYINQPYDDRGLSTLSTVPTTITIYIYN
jgi:hypothetical protein